MTVAPGAAALALALWALVAAPLPPNRPVTPGDAAAPPVPSSAVAGIAPAAAEAPTVAASDTGNGLAPTDAPVPPEADVARTVQGVTQDIARGLAQDAASRPSGDAATTPQPTNPTGAVAAGGPAVPFPPRRPVGPDAARRPPSESAKLAALDPSAILAPRTPAPGAIAPQPDQFVCRDPRLAGAVIPPIGDLGAPCGITHPVRLTAVSGVAFDTPATLDCPTARRVAHWLTGVAEPLARQHFGSRIVEVDVMGSYSCRTRNNRPGGRISEHAMGRAIDVGGFRLADGRRISVREDWGRGAEGKFLGALHRHSCGLFMTVLGPAADRFHHDHFHLDTARRNGDTYCR